MMGRFMLDGVVFFLLVAVIVQVMECMKPDEVQARNTCLSKCEVQCVEESRK
jgi:hypothetical protein